MLTNFMRLSEDNINLLISKKRDDLTAMGISPIIFYQASKMLDEMLSYQMKDGTEFFFSRQTGSRSKTIDTFTLRRLLMVTFSFDDYKATTLFDEWVRDKRIYHGMIKNQVKYWKWLSLPTSEIIKKTV
jgi:hypothetical protein